MLNTITLLNTNGKTIAKVATKSLQAWLSHNGYKVYGYTRKDNAQAILIIK